MRRLIIVAAAVAAVLSGGAVASATPIPLAGVNNLQNGQCYRIIPVNPGYGNIAYHCSTLRFDTIRGGAFTNLCTYKYHGSANIWLIQDEFAVNFAAYYDHGTVCGNCVTELPASYTSASTPFQWFIQNDGGGKFDIYNVWTMDHPDPNCGVNDRDLNATGAGIEIQMECQDIPNGVFFEWFFYVAP